MSGHPLEGALVLEPSHLEGACVLSVFVDSDDGPEWNHAVELTLDRAHPDGGYIGVDLDDVTLDVAVA